MNIEGIEFIEVTQFHHRERWYIRSFHPSSLELTEEGWRKYYKDAVWAESIEKEHERKTTRPLPHIPSLTWDIWDTLTKEEKDLLSLPQEEGI